MNERIDATAAPRSLRWPTAATVAALAVLLWLGNWQLERREWKHELMARIEERAALAAQAMPDARSWPGLDLDLWEYRPVWAEGRFEHDAEAHVFTSLSDPRGALGGSGYWVMTPLRLASGAAVIVNRGFVPLALKEPATRRAGQVEGEVEVAGLVREPQAAGPFVPDPDIAGNIWYARDIGAIADAQVSGDVAPFFIDAEASDRYPVPQGGETRLELSDPHLGYAVTWFGLAGALGVVYLALCSARLRQRRVQ